MKPRFLNIVVTIIVLWSLFFEMNAQQTSASYNSSGGTGFQPSLWPHSFPARVIDGLNKEFFVMTLGDVKTTVADGVFNPSNDQFVFNDGRIIKNYYSDSLGIKYFKPIDKSVFPLPPSGWCSWYYYFQELNETEILLNAKWISKNLKDFGATYLQIDDGWQGSGHGWGDNRDWTTIDKRFSCGMDKLASSIKSLGLKPGIWLAPHGQSNISVVKNNPRTFLLRPDDSSASDTWEGKFLLDPSTTESQIYLTSLFSTFSRWGYEYYKIDGQPIVINEYRKKKSFMRIQSDNVDELYRTTLKTIRSAIGKNSYLLGCWGTPVEGIGIMNGSRTGGDVLLGWDGFLGAVNATMKRYYLHNIAWYSDPDVMLLRSPLTIDQARAWATLQGITGQALMSSDRMMDLPAERIEILKRVYPAVDIRPLDLFPSKNRKKIWDLKIKHLDRNYDVVSIFNFNTDQTSYNYVKWSEIGLPDTIPVHVFDFWNKEYLGAWKKGMSFDINPTSCRLLTLLPDNGKIQLISTNRHISQGWIDLKSINFDEKKSVFNGTSKVVENDSYELRFVFPHGTNFEIKNATAEKLPVKISNHQGWATVQFTSPKTAEVTWQVSFQPAALYHFPVRKPYDLSVEPSGLDAVNIRWNSDEYIHAEYRILVNGELLGYTLNPVFPLRNLIAGKMYNVEVRTVWESNSLSSEGEKLSFSLSSQLPNEVYLPEVEPASATIGWGTIGVNRSVSGKTLSVDSVKYSKGIGTHADSDIEYRVQGLYSMFTTRVGVDDGYESDRGSVEFSVLGDGKELWRSGVMKKYDSLKVVSININNVRSLILRVTNAGDGNDYDHADWIEPRVIKSK